MGVGIASIISTTGFSLVAYAKNPQYYAFEISGTQTAYTPYSTKGSSGEPFVINAYAPFDWQLRGKIVLKATMVHSNDAYRGYCEVYEGTRNTGKNSGEAYDQYRLRCIRQYHYDGKPLTQGQWAADQY